MENSYIPFATFPWLSVGNLEQSKFNYFKKECHITIIESHRSYTPVLATREQAELLQVAPNSLPAAGAVDQLRPEPGDRRFLRDLPEHQ